MLFRVKQALEEKIQSLQNGHLVDIDRDEILLILDIFRALKDLRVKYERPVLPKCKLCARVKEKQSEMIRRTRKSLYEKDEKNLSSAAMSPQNSFYGTQNRSKSSKTEGNQPSRASPRVSGTPAEVNCTDGATENSEKAKAAGRNRSTFKRSAVVLDLDETVVEYPRNGSTVGTVGGQTGSPKRSWMKTVFTGTGNNGNRRSSSESSRRQGARESTVQHSSHGSKSDRRKSTMLESRIGIEALARLSTVTKPRRSLHSHQPGCKCDIIAAKVEFELSKHYKNAGEC